MLNEFYKYVANNMFGFFQSKTDTLRCGERYCLKMDTEEMVQGVDKALRDVTAQHGILGNIDYMGVYSTFTIKLSDKMEIIVASKKDGMTDDFLATLRNAKLSENAYTLLMLTHSVIDTISSGTVDLSANGMPFHAKSIMKKIQEDINGTKLLASDRKLLEIELKRKQTDRFSDKSSLFEYTDLITVLGRGYVKDSDYILFGLIPDPDIKNYNDDKKIYDRIEDNHLIFERINSVFKHGNIKETLGAEFDKIFIDKIENYKKKSKPWYENLKYSDAKESQDKLKKKLEHPLIIEDSNISAYSYSPINYSFDRDSKFFIRCDGGTKLKQRKKNILIFNPDRKDEITVAINTNISVKQNWVEGYGGNIVIASRQVMFTVKPNGCTFALVKVQDSNNIVYNFKICILDIEPNYLENIQTSYLISMTKSMKNEKLQIFGLKDRLVINPYQGKKKDVNISSNGVFVSVYNETLNIIIGEEDIDSECGYLDFTLQIGSISIPLRIQDEMVKPVELTGIAAFKMKHSQKRSLEYREGNKIVVGTNEYFAREPFKSILELESLFIEKGWLAIRENIDGYEEYPLKVNDNLKKAYISLLERFRELRTVPSLGYYKEESKLHDAAKDYIKVVENEFAAVTPGESLSTENNDALLIGCVIKNADEKTISMSPLHPLNVLYQLKLLEEHEIGKVRDNLVEKLTSLYLLPYIKDKDKIIYHAIEQKYSPEWHCYAPSTNKKYQGARNFVQKLVADKIIQYHEHFSFLFEDIGNNLLCINLVNMGDCREAFQGILRYYVQCAREGISYDDMLSFDVNVYAQKGIYNEFSLLADMNKLKIEIRNIYGVKESEDISELAIAMANKIRCFYKNPDEDQYKYAHLTFYEMTSVENSGASRMESITTGISLGGVTSGTPSVLNSDWYKTGFGTKYAEDNPLIKLATCYNSMFRVAFSGSSYEPKSCMFTEIAQGQEGQLGKIYKSSNWVVFVDPKVDLSFFKKKDSSDDELMIIHYSDQYTSSSGYDDITVTQKSMQYNEIIADQLQKKGVTANTSNINNIISLFNAINGGWMLRLITAKKLSGATDSYFSREKMSILSAIKLCMAYYKHDNIVWVPISLEEMLRVSGGAGLSQKDGILSAKNLGFEQRATSDDVLLVGIEGSNDDIKVYLHPVEVKIGQNPINVIEKAKKQVINTYQGLWNALWPDNDRNTLERKLSRNFFMQLVLVCCEKLKLYEIYPDETWDLVLDSFRKKLLNEEYIISKQMDEIIGKGTVVSFGTNVLNKSGKLDQDGICLLEMPEKLGSSYMVLTAKEIEKELDGSVNELPIRLKYEYKPVVIKNVDTSQESNKVVDSEVAVQDMSVDKVTIDTQPLSENNDETINSNIETEDDSMQDKIESVEETKGIQIVFGSNVESGEKLIWCPNDTNQIFHTNTGIIGTMGTGKTQFTKSMIAQMYKERIDNIGDDALGILIFDYKGDYNESKEDFVEVTKATVLKPYHLPFNPLSLTKSNVVRPLLPIHTANAFKDTLSKVYGLGAKQQNILFQCIIDAYALRGILPADSTTWDNVPPTFDTVYSLYKNDDSIKKTDSLAAAMDKLRQFQVFESVPEKTKSLFELLDGVVVIDLSGYDSDIQNLIVAITLDLFYTQMQASGSSNLDGQYRQITKMILVDEADNFMSQSFPALKKILKEGREFGVGTILSTQFLKHFGTGEDDYSKYILTWVVHNVADLKSSDVEFVFQVEPKSLESQNLFNNIKSLQKHYSIVKVGNSKPNYIEDKAFWQLYKEFKAES